MRRMLITLIFVAVAKKSKAFSRFPCSPNEQVYKGCQGAWPGRGPKLAKGNIPYHGHQAQFIKWGWLGGRNLFSENLTVFFP